MAIAIEDPSMPNTRTSVRLSPGVINCLTPSIFIIGLVAFQGCSGESTTVSKTDAVDERGAALSFVGEERCAECHAEIAALHSQHGHAHTFAAAGQHPLATTLPGSQILDPERNVTYRYSTSPGGLSVECDAVPGRMMPLHFALGSGRHAGVTFLSIVKSQSGEPIGIEHRLSWLSKMNAMGITPGHVGSPVTSPPEQHGMIYRGEQLEKCIGCHTTTFSLLGTSVIGLEPNVSCEACHGPGSAHVQAQENSNDVSTDSVLVTAIQEIEMCGRCHRLSEEFKPHELDRTDNVLPRFQSAGLVQSRCFTESNGQLRCTTCHDPHRPGSDFGADHYESKCRDCHGAASDRRQIVCPIDATTGCVECHMPNIENVTQVVFRDHWIRIRDDNDPPAWDGKSVMPALPEALKSDTE